MKITIATMMLGLFLLSFASAYTYCEDGSTGAIKIISITDDLDDNTEAWKWDEGMDIEIEVVIKNNLDNRSNFTVELVFLNADDEVAHIAEGRSNLKESNRVDGNSEERFDFNFELDDDIIMDNYRMFVKSYVTENESNQCHQSEKSVRVNRFDACGTNPDLTIVEIKGSDNFEWWLGEKASVTVEIKSLLTKEEDYDIELVFHNSGSTEIILAEDGDDLLEQKSFANETVSISFDFILDYGISEGDYGLYARVTSDDICVDKRTSVSYKKGKKTFQNYNHISVKDTDGIIVESAEGLHDFTYGSEQVYLVTLSNTGEDEEKVRLWVYNNYAGIKTSVMINDFKKDTTREVKIPFTIKNKTGGVKLLFYADYDYNNKTGNYHESTSNFNHDFEQRVIVTAPDVIVPEEIVQDKIPDSEIEVINKPVVPAPVESKSIIPIIIVIFIFGIAAIGGLILYKRYKNTSVPQTNPYS